MKFRFPACPVGSSRTPLALLIVLGVSQWSGAQTAPPDTAVVRALFAVVLGEMGEEIADGLRLSKPLPWVFDLPRSDEWRGVETALARVLVSRHATNADRDQHFLTIRQTAASDSDRVFDATIGKRR